MMELYGDAYWLDQIIRTQRNLQRKVALDQGEGETT